MQNLNTVKNYSTPAHPRNQGNKACNFCIIPILLRPAAHCVVIRGHRLTAHETSLLEYPTRRRYARCAHCQRDRRSQSRYHRPHRIPRQTRHGALPGLRREWLAAYRLQQSLGNRQRHLRAFADAAALRPPHRRAARKRRTLAGCRSARARLRLRRSPHPDRHSGRQGARRRGQDAVLGCPAGGGGSPTLKAIPGAKEPEGAAKTRFWDALLAAAEARISEPLLFVGDFNTGMPLVDEAGSTFVCAEHFARLAALGWIDVWRHFHGGATEYTWYSQPKGGAPANGFRLDHAFATPDRKSTRL